MNYLQIGILAVISIILFIIWWVCFVDLNKDVTFQNKKTGSDRPRPKRRKMKGQSASGAYMPTIMGEGPRVNRYEEQRPISNRNTKGRKNSGNPSQQPNLKVYKGNGTKPNHASKRPPRES